MKRKRIHVLAVLVLAGSMLASFAFIGQASSVPRGEKGNEGILVPGAANDLDPKYSGYDVELVRQTGGEFLGVAVVGSLAYVTYGQRLGILDISDPAHPSLVGKTDPMVTSSIAVAVSGSYAYLASPGIPASGGGIVGGGMYVVDVSNPSHPQQVAFLADGITIQDTGSPQDIKVYGNFAYFVDLDRGLSIVDIHDPLHPTVVKIVPVGGMDLDLAQHNNGNVYAYIAGQAAADLNIINVTDPSNAGVVGTFNTPNDGIDVEVQGNYAYLITDPAFLKVVLISDPAHPVEVGSMEGVDLLYGPFAVAGSYAYLMDYDGFVTGQVHLRVVSLTDIAHPNIVGSLLYYGSENIEIASTGGQVYAYLAANGMGLRAVNVTTPTSPVEAGYYNEEGYVDGVVRQGSLAYVTGDGLRVLSYDSPKVSHPVGFLDTPGRIDSVESQTAFLLKPILSTPSSPGKLQLVNVSNPAAPSLLGSFNTTGMPMDVAVRGNFAYLADDNGSIRIIGITDTLHLSQVSFINFTSIPLTIDVTASHAQPGQVYAYVGADDNLKIINVTDPAHPVEVGHYNPPSGIVRRLAVYQPAAGGGNKDYVVIASGNYYNPEIRLVDVSNPASPTATYIDTITDHVDDLAVQGDYAYIAGGFAGLRIYLLTNIVAGFEDAYYRLPAEVNRLDVDGDFISLAAGGDGLWDVWFGPSSWGTIDAAGGEMNSTFDSTDYLFASNTFTETVYTRHRPRFWGNMPVTPGLEGIQHYFESYAENDYGDPFEPVKPYTITIHYSDADLGANAENSLALYYWNGSFWVREPSSLVDATQNTLTAHPSHFSLWGVLGGAKSLFLPAVIK